MKIPLRLLLCLLLLCCAGRTWATVLVLNDTSASVSARGYLQSLSDPHGELSPEQALRSGAWRALPASLSAGYTYDFVWLQLQVRVDDGTPNWVLRLSNALVDDVRFYQRNSRGDWEEARAGEDLPRAQWLVDYRSAVRRLNLPPGQTHTLLLRLHSKNAMSVSLDLTPRHTFAEASRREYLAYGLYFGIYLMLIGFHVVFWRMTRAQESGWYLCYVSCCVAIEALTIGLPQELLHLPVSLSDPLLGVAMALSIPIGIAFAGRQLGLPQVMPGLMRYLQWGSWPIGLGAALLTVADHYREAAPIVQLCAMVMIVVFISLALYLLVRGHRPARFYLLAFGIYYAGVIISFLRNFGMLPANLLTDNAATVGTLLHMGIMSMRIISHYNRIKREKERLQAIAAAQTLLENARLEQQVALRTSELSAEIRRRAALEQDLRVALEHEQQVRAEQNEFVAMVSHELRTPLAIINTSAQQLAKHLDAPIEKSQRRCQNIRDAVMRLLALVDDYLTRDRMDEPSPQARFAQHDLHGLLAGLQAEFSQGRVHLDYRSESKHIHCDGGLLYVAARNLLANADRHAPPEARIALEVDGDERRLSLQVRHPGPEIPEDERERLFHKYYRGRQAQRSAGAGLGLYMVRRIAQLHGGDAALVGSGGAQEVCFRLELGLAAEAAG